MNYNHSKTQSSALGFSPIYLIQSEMNIIRQ